MRRWIAGSVAMLAMAGASVAQAQVPVSLELRGGAAFPTADFGDASLKTGAGAGFALGYRIMPHLALYAGWDWMRFATETPFRGADYDVENTGYAFGLQFQHPMARNAGYWVRAGGLYNHIELEGTNGDLVADSGHEFGWEAGGGLSVPIGARFALTPGIRYRALSAQMPMGQANVPVDLTFVAVEIGFQFNFGARQGMASFVR